MTRLFRCLFDITFAASYASHIFWINTSEIKVLLKFEDRMKSVLLQSPIFVILLALFLNTNTVEAQWVKISEDGGRPDSSAALEIKSTSRGMLIPRLTTSEMNAIPSPKEGLMLYNTTDSVFFFYSSGSWNEIGEIPSEISDSSRLADDDGDTRVELPSSNDGDSIRFVTNGQRRLVIDSLGNTAIGNVAPDSLLTVDGGIKLKYFTLTNAPTLNHVLTSDANGVGTWQPRIMSKTGNRVYYTGGQFSIGTSSTPGVYFSEFETPSNTSYPISFSIDQNYTGAAQTFGAIVDLSSDGTGLKYGFYSVVQQNSGQTNTIHGVVSDLKLNGGAGNGIGLYSTFTGSTSGDKYGIYSLNEDYNYFSGSVGIGVIQPRAKLDVAGAIILDSVSVPTPRSGMLQYTGTEMQFYDGTNWVSLTPAGTVEAFAGDTSKIPTGWLLCDGSAVSRTTYTNLFSVIGENWGEGDGTSTFNLPDLRGRFLRGQNLASGNDPDAAARSASAAGGNTGDNVGSVQDDEFKSHTHTATPGGSSSGSLLAGISTLSRLSGSTTGATGGNETRPKNANVVYIIKY